MAARKRAEKNQKEKDLLRAAALMNRLADNAEGKLRKPMTAGQIRSATAWLAKHRPDLKAVEVTGDSTNTQFIVGAKPLTREDYEREFTEGTVDPTTGTPDTSGQLPN